MPVYFYVLSAFLDADCLPWPIALHGGVLSHASRLGRVPRDHVRVLRGLLDSLIPPALLYTYTLLHSEQ